jgi:hypothetical protein
LKFFAIILLVANFIVVPIALITVVPTGNGKSIKVASTSTRVKGIAAPHPENPEKSLIQGRQRCARMQQRRFCSDQWHL